MVCEGTKALDRNVSGKIQMKPTVFAASGVFTESPINAPIQLIA